jgi:hypothetical protein
MAPSGKTKVESIPDNAVTPVQPARPLTAMAVISPIVGWLVPGLGHIIQRRWIRGALIAGSVFVMFLLGLAMQGKVYSANTGDILDMLGFVGDIGAGLLYIVTKAANAGQGAIHIATADYGTKYLIAAGLLNVISAIDAYHIAIGKKE